MKNNFIKWVAIKDNILQHISKNLPLWTWWQPRWCLITTTDRYINHNHHSNNMILSPFDIKGKGQIKTKTRFLFPCRKMSFEDLMYAHFTMLPLSSCCIFKLIFQWSTWINRVWTFLSPRTHTYINDPTKWNYIFDSTSQPSGFTNFDSTTQPSGFTNLNKSLHEWI